jgi:UDP-glucose 4-epimerase
MRKNDAGQLVFASSSNIYGEPPQIPVDEEAPSGRSRSTAQAKPPART